MSQEPQIAYRLCGMGKYSCPWFLRATPRARVLAHATQRDRRKRPRRGSVYIAIVSISMLVAVIGVGSLLAVRSQSKGADASNDALEARVYAASAVEIGKQLMYSDSSWRTNHSNGT